MTAFRLTRQNRHDEHNLQERIVSYLYLMHCRMIDTDVMDAVKYLSPLPTDTLHEKRRKEQEKQKYISIHKRRGYTNGQPDLVILRPNGQILFAELKTPTGIQSAAQKDFQKQAEFMGFEYVIWRSLDDCIKFFHKSGTNNNNERVAESLLPNPLALQGQEA